MPPADLNLQKANPSSSETNKRPRAVSPFKFPPSLSARHEEELRKRGISREFALASGVRTAADNELRELNFQASLPHEERSKGLQGICFPYVDLELNAEAAWRIKPDTTFTMSDGSHPKYLSRLGDKPRAFFPHTTMLEMLPDPKINVVITEGEYKTLAIAEIPDNDNGEKVGADDYIAKNGQYAFLKLLWNNWTAQRDVDKVLYRANAESLVFVEAREMVKIKPPRPVFVIDKLLPEGGTMIVAAAPKVGKSGIALNAAKAIATGEDFLGVFPVRKGRAVYVQTEIPAWAMAERLKLMGDLPEGMLIHTPGKFKLNLWEEDGYQKKRETGNRERVAGLIEALRAQAASLVIFDPLRHFHSLNELNVDHVAHLFEVFRAIGRAVPCGVMIVHHHRKTARSQVDYEGAEDMAGSGALFGEADSIVSIYKKTRRSDDSRRYKMVFDLRHAETPDPMELFRMGGENSMLWTAEPWTDTPSDQVDESLDRILAVLGKDRMARYKAKAIEDMAGIKRTALYAKLNQLVRSGQIKKDGNLYYVSD
jgi:hypothetical protein